MSKEFNIIKVVRNWLFAIALFAALPHGVVKAQLTLPIDPKTQKVTYSKTVQMPFLTKKDLLGKVQYWLSNQYGSSAIWQNRDAESGHIKVRVKMDTEVTYFVGKVDGGAVFYTVDISCVDGSYTYRFKDFYHEGSASISRSGGALENQVTDANYFTMPVQWDEIKEQVDRNIQEITTGLVMFINQKR